MIIDDGPRQEKWGSTTHLRESFVFCTSMQEYVLYLQAELKENALFAILQHWNMFSNCKQAMGIIITASFGHSSATQKFITIQTKSYIGNFQFNYIHKACFGARQPRLAKY